MQLSVAATMLKHRGLAINAAQPLMLLLKMLHREDPGDAASTLRAGIPHFRLHFISLYMASLHNQPGVDWGLSSSPLDPFSYSTDEAAALAHTILSLHGIVLERLSNLHGIVLGRLSNLACAVHLGSSLALAVMTTGPVWATFAAAARVGLHPCSRLRSSQQNIAAEGYHVGVSRVIASIVSVSSRLMLEAGDIGAAASSEGGVTSSTGQGSIDLGNKEEISTSEGLPSQEQRNGILACVTATHVLLHMEALSCLIGQLWHARVYPRLLVSDTRNSSQQPGASGGSGSGSAAFGSCNGEQGCTVGQVLLTVFSDLRSVMGRAFDFAGRRCPRVVEGDESASASAIALGLKLLGNSLVRLEEVASDTPLTFLDVPTQAQAGVREEGLSILAQMKSLATELLAMMLHSNPESGPGSVGTSWGQWEVLQAALLRSLPPEQQEDWGQPLVCCNPGCTNLSGPSELQLKTYACGGGCGVRYCSRECQVQGWRLGHRHSCGEIVAGRA